MALLPGTITVHDDLSDTGTGLASEMYAALKAVFFDSGQGSAAAQLNALRGLGKIANALAPVIVAHIIAHAVVAVPATGIIAPGGGGPCAGAASGTVS